MKRLIGLWLLVTPAIFYAAAREDSPRQPLLLDPEGDVIMDAKLFLFKHSELGIKSIHLYPRMKNSDLNKLVSTAFSLPEGTFCLRSNYDGKPIPSDDSWISFRKFLKKDETPFVVVRR